MNYNHDDVTKQIKNSIIASVEKDDFISAETLLGLWKEKRTSEAAIRAKLAKLSENTPQTNPPSTDLPTLRKVLVEITGGALRQNYLSLNKAVKRELIKRKEEFTIEIPAIGKTIETPFTRGATFLRERYSIAKFYEMALVKEGDFVELRETKPGYWILTKTTSPTI